MIKLFESFFKSEPKQVDPLSSTSSETYDSMMNDTWSYRAMTNSIGSIFTNLRQKKTSLIEKRDNSILTWRTTAEYPEVNNVVTEIVDVVLDNSDLQGYYNISLGFKSSTEKENTLQKKINEEFKTVLTKLNWDDEAHDIIKSMYVDSMVPFEIIVDNDKIKWLQSNKEEFNQSWNFGPNTEQKFLTVKEIADYILNKSNSSLKIDFSGNPNQPFESKRLMIDPSKAYTNLGWKNIYTVDDTLSETIAWYKTYENKQEDMKEFSISQIDNYISSAKQVNINWTK